MTAGDAQNNGMNSRPNNLDEALNRCLRAVESGQISVEECVARFPQFPELEALLHTALLVNDLPRPPMPTAFTLRTQRRLQSHLRDRVRAAQRSRASTWWSSLGRLAVITGIFILILFAGGAVLVRASESAIPGDALYPIKRTTEQVSLTFANSITRPPLLVTLAQTRIQEIGTLSERGRTVQAAWVDDMYGSISKALTAEPDQAKRDLLATELTASADSVMQTALDKGVVSSEVANGLLVKLQQLLGVPGNLASNSTANSSGTATTAAPAVAVAATFTATSTSTSTPTAQILSPTPTNTSTYTATPTGTPTPTWTATASATFTPATKGTVQATSNNAVAPTFTPTLGPGPARVLTGIPTNQITPPGTQSVDGSTAIPTQSATESATLADVTEAATLLATDQPTDTVTATNTNTATSTP